MSTGSLTPGSCVPIGVRSAKVGSAELVAYSCTSGACGTSCTASTETVAGPVPPGNHWYQTDRTPTCPVTDVGSPGSVLAAIVCPSTVWPP